MSYSNESFSHNAQIWVKLTLIFMMIGEKQVITYQKMPSKNIKLLDKRS